ncbi:MAG TPA: hypothetical protein VGS04_02065 [Nitrososphaerales archaeon]|nr:hypothetical protein [Nitrososphaerales archaeon]
MPTRTTYGVAVTLVALLIISATAGAYYYYEYQQAAQSKNEYVSELRTETSQYNGLASNYNSSLALYNQTFALLVRAIAVVNTSLPIYQQASSQLSQLWGRYLSLKPAASSLYAADILIDFGNGTRVWYNDTQVQPGWNMYVESVVLSHGNLQAQWYPSYQEHLISAIDGVSDTETMGWFLWTYNATAAWQTSQVGADLLPVYNGSVIAWTFCGETASYAPQCTP